MNELALFAGAGGGILGGKLLGWRTVCAVEWEPYAACVLAARQNDGLLPIFPIWDDVQTFDGKPWRGIVDVVSGGFPCQDISAAGKGAGIEGERSGMWKEMARIIGEVRPRFAFVENSPMLTSRGLGVVLGDLATLGYDAEWGVISAADTGAPHLRERIWIVAHAIGSQKHGIRRTCEQGRNTVEWDWKTTQQNNGEASSNGFSGCNQSKTNMANATQLFSNGGNNNARELMERKAKSEFGNDCRAEDVADTNSAQCQGNQRAKRGKQKYTDFSLTSGWPVEPNVGRVANGVAARVDRLKAIGNGQVPRVAATAFELLNETN